jgi:hypothetical protein
MDRQEAVRLIQETFNNSFDEDRFRYFTRNLFNEVYEEFEKPKIVWGNLAVEGRG